MAVAEGEFEELDARFRRLAKRQEIAALLQQATDALSGEDSNGADAIRHVAATLARITDDHAALSNARALLDTALTHLDGRDPDVAKFVFGPDGSELVRHVENLLRFSLPQFQKEGKLYVTICVGCTGGRHRSVAVVEELRRRLGTEWDILVRHRDVDRGE